MIRFGTGQSFAVDTHGVIDQSPALSGTYELNDREIVVTVTGVGPCAAGDTWTWRAGLPDAGRLQLVFVETGTGNCGIPVGTEWSFIRLSPRSSAGAELTADSVGAFSALPGDPEETVARLDGRRHLEGGGHLLRLRPYGTYAIDDRGLLGTEPADAGTIDARKATLTLTSVAGSERCDAGDRPVLANVRLDESGLTLRATVGANECRHRIGARTTWIRLSP